MAPLMRFARLPLILLGLAAGAGAAVAGWTPPPTPTVVVGTTDIDPSKYDWLSDSARKGLVDSIAKLKSGSFVASVFAASPTGNYWSYRSAAKTSEIYSLEDLARQALQYCEYSSQSPCFIVAVNGKEARDANGSMPVQAAQLVEVPAKFDASIVPFLDPTDQRYVAGYAAETKSRALVITPSGGWLWRTGDTAFAAVASADTDCKKNYPDDTCILYAIDSRAVFTPNDPN